MNEKEDVKIEVTPELEKTTEKILQEMDIFDDVFARALFNKTEFVEEVIKNVTGKQDVKIKTVQTQKPIDNILNHSIVLDVFARDVQGNIYNIELQRSSEGANKERVRYYSGLTESEALKKGQEYSQLPEKWTIFITEKDLFNAGFPFYHIDSTVRETGEPYKDGSNILYVNGSFSDQSTPAGRFIKDLTSVNPEEVMNPVIKQGMQELKQKTKGEKEMSTAIMNNIGPLLLDAEEKGKKEQKIKTVLNSFSMGLSFDLIANIAELSVKEVKKILREENKLA